MLKRLKSGLQSKEKSMVKKMNGESFRHPVEQIIRSYSFEGYYFYLDVKRRRMDFIFGPMRVPWIYCVFSKPYFQGCQEGHSLDKWQTFCCYSAVEMAWNCGYVFKQTEPTQCVCLCVCVAPSWYESCFF